MTSLWPMNWEWKGGGSLLVLSFQSQGIVHLILIPLTVVTEPHIQMESPSA